MADNTNLEQSEFLKFLEEYLRSDKIIKMPESIVYRFDSSLFDNFGNDRLSALMSNIQKKVFLSSIKNPLYINDISKVVEEEKADKTNGYQYVNIINDFQILDMEESKKSALIDRSLGNAISKDKKLDLSFVPKEYQEVVSKENEYYKNLLPNMKMSRKDWERVWLGTGIDFLGGGAITPDYIFKSRWFQEIANSKELLSSVIPNYERVSSYIGLVLMNLPTAIKDIARNANKMEMATTTSFDGDIGKAAFSVLSGLADSMSAVVSAIQPPIFDTSKESFTVGELIVEQPHKDEDEIIENRLLQQKRFLEKGNYKSFEKYKSEEDYTNEEIVLASSRDKSGENNIPTDGSISSSNSNSGLKIPNIHNPAIKKLLDSNPDLFSNQFDTFIEIIPKSHNYEDALSDSDSKVFDLSDLINGYNKREDRRGTGLLQSPLVLSARIENIDIPLKNSLNELTDFKYIGTSLVKTDNMRSVEGKSKLSIRGDANLFLVDVFNKLSENTHSMCYKDSSGVKFFKLRGGVKFLDIAKSFPSKTYYINIYVKKEQLSKRLASMDSLDTTVIKDYVKNVSNRYLEKFDSIVTRKIIDKVEGTVHPCGIDNYMVIGYWDSYQNYHSVKTGNSSTMMVSTLRAISKNNNHGVTIETWGDSTLRKNPNIPIDSQPADSIIQDIKNIEKEADKKKELIQNKLKKIDKSENIDDFNPDNIQSIKDDIVEYLNSKIANNISNGDFENGAKLNSSNDEAFKEKLQIDENFKLAKNVYDILKNNYDSIKIIKDLSKNGTTYNRSLYDTEVFIFEDCKFSGTSNNIELDTANEGRQSFSYDFIYKRFLIDEIERTKES